MAITLNGTTGITTPDITSEAGLTVDGVSFASGAPANTLVTTSSGNVGIGTSSPAGRLQVKQANTSYGLVVEASGNDAWMRFHHNDSLGIVETTYNTSAGYTPLTFKTGGTERARIDSSGNLLVGTTSAQPLSASWFAGRIVSVGSGNSNGYYSVTTDSTTSYCYVAANNGTAGQALMSFHNYNGTTNPQVGNISHNGTSTTYATSSDYRLKENVVGVTGAAARVQQLNPVRFNFIADPDRTVDGFLAHEVQDVVPEAITGTKDAVDAEGNPVYQGIDQSKLVPLLTAALQEALGKIETLEARVAALEAA